MTITNFEQLNDTHMDVLKEIGNIGAGNAATSLSQMLNRKVDMTTPVVRVLDLAEASMEMGGPETPVVAILVGMHGDIQGTMMFIIDSNFTKLLIETLLGESDVKCEHLTDMEKSALSEIGNIMMGSYTAAISALSGLNITISVPAVAADMVGAILTAPAMEMGDVSEKVIFIEDGFKGSDETISADIMLIPKIDSLNKLMDSLGITL